MPTMKETEGAMPTTKKSHPTSQEAAEHEELYPVETNT